MYQIYDTFEITKKVLDRYKDLMFDLDEGLVIIFEPKEMAGIMSLIGRTAEITKPNGEIVKRQIVQVKIRGSSVGLLLKDLKAGDIPIGSTLSLM
jgi:hypothetical protein